MELVRGKFGGVFVFLVEGVSPPGVFPPATVTLRERTNCAGLEPAPPGTSYKITFLTESFPRILRKSRSQPHSVEPILIPLARFPCRTVH